MEMQCSYILADLQTRVPCNENWHVLYLDFWLWVKWRAVLDAVGN